MMESTDSAERFGRLPNPDKSSPQATSPGFGSVHTQIWPVRSVSPDARWRDLGLQPSAPVIFTGTPNAVQERGTPKK